jgi:hypothetical protein
MGIIVGEKNVYALNEAIDKILKSDLKQMKINARMCAEENAWEIQEIKMVNAFKIKLDEK